MSELSVKKDSLYTLETVEVNMSAVTCMSWVKRGVAKQQPDRVKLTADELKELIKTQEQRLRNLGVEDVSDDEDDTGAAAAAVTPGKKRKHDHSSGSKKKTDPDFDDIIDKYGLDDYEDDDKGQDEIAQNSMSDVAFYSNLADDPYVQDEDSDEEELEIRKDDNVVAIGRVKGNYCILEAHVYNESDSALFCHHDILLPSFPLALEWIDYDPSDPDTISNLVAMGTMEPDIEIWDLDVIDSLEPACVLRGVPKKAKMKKKKGSVLGHSDAVLDLSWNPHRRKVLASASADFTIGLWDLENGTMVTSITKHEEKVQTLKWHPVEAETLLSGSFDHTMKVYDCRGANDNFKNWSVDGEVERVIWNHHNPFYFFASTDNGSLYMCDVRKDEVVAEVKAHSAAITGLCLSSSLNCLVTVSADKSLKAWDVQKGSVELITEKKMKMGELHSAAMSPDSQLVVAVGGETDFRVVNLARNEDVAKHYGLNKDTQDKEKDDEVVLDAGLDTDEEEMEASSIKQTKKVTKPSLDDAPKKKKKKNKKKQKPVK